MKNNIIVIALAVVLVGGVSFYGGTVYAKSKAPAQNTRTGAFAGTGNGAAGGRFFMGGGQGQGRSMGGGFLSGQVVSKDASSITIQLRAAGGASGTNAGVSGSKIVLYSGSTVVSKMDAGSMDDIAPGTSVIVTGTPNSDGSVTAQMIQIRPENVGSNDGTGHGQLLPDVLPKNVRP